MLWLLQADYDNYTERIVIIAARPVYCGWPINLLLQCTAQLHHFNLLVLMCTILCSGRRAAAVAAAADLSIQLLPPSPRKDPDALPNYNRYHNTAGTSSGYAQYPVKDQEAAVPCSSNRGIDQGAGAHATAMQDPYSSSGHDMAYSQPFDAALESSDSEYFDVPQHSSAAFIVYALSIVVCMAASLSVFPGITAFICSVENPATTSPCAARTPFGRFEGDLFVPAMFVVFAVGDLTGRIVSSWGPWGRSPPPAVALLIYSILRLGLVGAVLFCHVITPTAWQLPTLFDNDYYSVAIIGGLGLTQGHLLSTACMHAPAVVPPGKEGEFGPVTGLCITAGCLIGSMASFLMMRVFTGGL